MSEGKLIWSNSLSKLDVFNGKVFEYNNIYIDNLNRIYIHLDRGIIKINLNDIISDSKIVSSFLPVSLIDTALENIDSVFKNKSDFRQIASHTIKSEKKENKKNYLLQYNQFLDFYNSKGELDESEITCLLKTEHLKKPPYLKCIKYQEYKNLTIAIAWLSNEKVKIILMDKFTETGSNIILECKRDLIMKSDFTEQVNLSKRVYPFFDSKPESPTNKNLDGNGFNIENSKIKRLNYIKDFDVLILGEILYIVILDETCIRLYKLYLDIELETLHKVKLDPVKNFYLSSVCKNEKKHFSQIILNKITNEQHINCTL